MIRDRRPLEHLTDRHWPPDRAWLSLQAAMDRNPRPGVLSIPPDCGSVAGATIGILTGRYAFWRRELPRCPTIAQRRALDRPRSPDHSPPHGQES